VGRWSPHRAAADYFHSLLSFGVSRMPDAAFAGSRVIVAGGTAGFGLVLARHLHAAGARVLLVGRSSQGVRQGLSCFPQASERSGRVHGLAADLSRKGEGERTAAEGVRLLGGMDAVFFCVGRSGRGAILRTSPERLREFLDANLLAAVELTTATADDVARAGGSLVYIGSLAGKLASPFVGPYAVGKAALAAYVEAVRLELAPRGGHVLLVSPGPIGRRSDDPAVNRSADRYADEIRDGGLPPEAAAPGGTRRLTPIDPDALAYRVLAACRNRRSELVVPRKAAMMAGLIDLFPDTGRRLLARFT
jgi:NAD(P)-dependent dehydrogenase (short-subunit alcohol dehydrogenase family)